MARARKNSEPIQPPSKDQARYAEQKLEIIGITLIGLAILALIALFFDAAGSIGLLLKELLYQAFGQRGAILPVIFLGIAGWFFFGKRSGIVITRHFIALMIFFAWAVMVIHLTSGLPLDHSGWPLASEGGGAAGYWLAVTAVDWLGLPGAIVLIVILLAIAFILILDRPLLEVIQGIWRRQPPGELPAATARPAAAPIPAAIAEEEPEELPYEPENPPIPNNVIVFPSKPSQSNPVLTTLQNMLKEKEKGKSEKKETADSASDKTPLAAERLVLGPYKLPDPSLVGTTVKTKKAGRVLDQSRKLEETLANFGVQAKVIEVHYGPVITRYDLQPAPGVKVSRIVNLADDLALALAAKGLRLEAPIPGKAAIGIEVPNQEAQVVTFRDMLDAKSFWNTGKLCIALGTDIGGEAVMADLTKMPHLLIAGATGSGKSVCVNTLVMSILYKAFPNEVKIIMVDPKMVELSMYNGIPHLMAPVVTEAKKAAGVLKLVVDEMERRYKMFAEARVRDLVKYNEQAAENETLPYIVVLIDELADLMMVAAMEVEDSICRLAQMARATGIHLVIATQRPSVDVITGLIKANIPSRIAFAVSSQIDSRTILDSPGAERLLGRGDMLYAPVGGMKPRRVQGALVMEKEIEAVIAHWKSQGEPAYQEQFTNIPDPKDNPVEMQDDLFWDAARIVTEFGQASASVLQRRLRVGYTRAARLVDMLEAKGLIGPYEGSKPREVYITIRQLEEMRKRSEEG